MKHPMQPVKEGRFVANEILLHLFKAGKIDLNEIAGMDFPDEDRRQLAQLLGYRLSGYQELEYVKPPDMLELGVDRDAIWLPEDIELQTVYVYPDGEQYDSPPEWKSDDYVVRQTTVCPDCRDVLDMDYEEPFASCQCRTMEWYL